MIENLENEAWKDIEGYEGIYQISNLGRVKSFVRKERLLTPTNNGNDYFIVGLGGRKNRKNHYIHRLVAQAFIPNPNNLPEVNHKDENTYNNKLNNLEWCDRKYNCNYGNHNKNLSKAKKELNLKGENNPLYGRKMPEETKKLISDRAKERFKDKTNHPNCKPIICLNTLEKFSSITEASEELKCDKSFISQICKGKRKSTKGYKFMYYEEYVKQAS